MKNFQINSKILYGIIFTTMLYGCMQEKEGKNFDAVISSMKEMSDLGTVEYKFTKILKAEDDATWYKVGARKMLINSKAYVKAGVDFSQIIVESIDESKASIKIKMPLGKIISLNIPPDEIKVLFSEAALLRNNFSNKEINTIQIMGEKDIKLKIKDIGIELEAAKNAKNFLDKWLRMSGFKEVIII